MKKFPTKTSSKNLFHFFVNDSSFVFGSVAGLAEGLESCPRPLKPFESTRFGLPLPAASDSSGVQIPYLSYYLEAHLLLLCLGCLGRQRWKRRLRDWRELLSKSRPRILSPTAPSSAIALRLLSRANKIRLAKLYCPEGHFSQLSC